MPTAGMVGETLAAIDRRPGGAGAVVQMWMDSPPHRAIVLDVTGSAGSGSRGAGARWAADSMAVVTADFASRR